MMNKNNYLELLCDYLPESFDKCNAHVFWQDCTSCHTAKSVKPWLKDCKVNYSILLIGQVIHQALAQSKICGTSSSQAMTPWQGYQQCSQVSSSHLGGVGQFGPPVIEDFG